MAGVVMAEECQTGCGCAFGIRTSTHMHIHVHVVRHPHPQTDTLARVCMYVWTYACTIPAAAGWMRRWPGSRPRCRAVICGWERERVVLLEVRALLCVTITAAVSISRPVPCCDMHACPMQFMRTLTPGCAKRRSEGMLCPPYRTIAWSCRDACVVGRGRGVHWCMHGSRHA